MPVPHIAPCTLDAWLQQLGEVRLSIDEDEQIQLLRTLADERLSLREVTARVHSAPSFVLAIIREANRGLNEPITTTEAALRRLGLTRAGQVLRAMPQCAAANNEDTMLQQLLLVSLHATQQAEGLFGARLARLSAEIHLCTLLFLAPLWPLALKHPALLQQWIQRVIINGESALTVEQALFGLPLRSLCQALAEHWQLPQWVQLGYRLLGRDRRRLVQALHIAHSSLPPLQQQQQLDDAPALRRWLTQPANTILLANGIAVASPSGWQHSHMLRWQQLTALYLNTPLDVLQQQTHQQAVISARTHAHRRMWHPASTLVYTAAQQLHTTPQATQTAALDAHAWALQMQRLKQTSSLRNAVQLFDCARDALLACGLERLLLLVANRNHSQVLIQNSHGIAHPPSRTPIACSNGSILARLLQRPSRLVLSTDNYARLATLLPTQLRALFPEPPLLLQSLAGASRVRIIIMAQWSPSDANPAQAQYVTRTLLQLEHSMALLLTAHPAPRP